MALQKVFKEPYVDWIKESISIDKYGGEEFEYDAGKTKYLANISKPEGLLDKLMSAENDFQAAIALYEAYPNLTPIIASQQKGLWVYLTHVDLFPYVQKRWPKVITGEADVKYISEHWFYNGTMRTSLMGLWWSVYCSVDDSRGADHKYDLTELLFKQEDFRTRTFGTYQLFRCKEAVLGVLEFLYENKNITNSFFESRSRYISEYFNKLGAVKQLAYLNKEFFKAELEKHKQAILAIQGR